MPTTSFLQMTIEVHAPKRCETCEYDLTGLPVTDGQVTCPECNLHQPATAKPLPPPIGWRRALLSVASPWLLFPVCFAAPLFSVAIVLVSATMALGISENFGPVQRSSHWAQFGAAVALWLLANTGVLALLLGVLIVLPAMH